MLFEFDWSTSDNLRDDVWQGNHHIDIRLVAEVKNIELCTVLRIATRPSITSARRRGVRIDDQGTRFVPVRRRAGVLRVYDFNGAKALFDLEMKAGKKAHDLQWIRDGLELLG